ncbi:glycosyltransferase [Enterobacteriaceae bacterium H11S18]|uniref:glycosyltransferase family 2 protein n=1 Tax=Dryocola clanedunensis TaxID=2925396 RepID=UPI0022F0F502|nr:glycosyltransferase family 2 protein [Dryocola clanedunensis]MCT4712319.1 glycosyltransferase [Dryocola clanedunensis]
MNDLVSVLIPVYNVERFVEETIVSLTSQTYKNIEIIVVDDCSTDQTPEVLDSLSKKYKNITVIRNRENLGIVSAMNEGLKYCSGKYIARIDGDDVAVKTRIEKQVAFLLKNPTIDIVGCSTSSMSETGEYLSTSTVACGTKQIMQTMHLYPPCCHIWLAKRKVYDVLEGYREIAPAEDYDFLLRAITSGFQIDNINEPLMKIRNRSGNTAEIAGLKQRKAHAYVLSLYRQRLVKSNLDDYSSENMVAALKSSCLENRLHAKSNALLKKGIMTKSKIIKVTLYFSAIFISHEQFKYYVNRIRYKFIIRMLK